MQTIPNSEAASSFLLDTSFILPTLGNSTGRETITALKKLDEAKTETYYSTLTLLESLWIAARTLHEKTFDEETFKLGLRSILEGGRYAKAHEDSWVLTEALSLYKQGHHDMIDNVLYATSARNDLRLLTLDAHLKDFLTTKGHKNTLTSPSQLPAR